MRRRKHQAAKWESRDLDSGGLGCSRPCAFNHNAFSGQLSLVLKIGIEGVSSLKVEGSTGEPGSTETKTPGNGWGLSNVVHLIALTRHHSRLLHDYTELLLLSAPPGFPSPPSNHLCLVNSSSPCSSLPWTAPSCLLTHLWLISPHSANRCNHVRHRLNVVRVWERHDLIFVLFCLFQLLL